MKSKLLNFDNYKSRWFKLTRTWLYYCDGKLENGAGRVKGQVLLSSVIIVEEAESEHLNNKPHAFQVVYRCGDLIDETCTLYIIALHRDLMLEWIEALRKACLEAGAEFSRMYHPGIWLSKLALYSCCDAINKRSAGCVPITHKVPESQLAVNGAVGLPGGGARSRHHASTKLKKSASMPARNPNSVYVVALYSYKSGCKDKLELRKGEEYELLEEYTPSSSSWLRAKDVHGNVGLIPANHVQLVNSQNMEQYDWYYKNTSRNESEVIVESDGREGCFMVRDSSRRGVFTLTLLVKVTSGNLTPKHYHIKQTSSDGQYYLVEKHPFTTVQQLIHYHKHNAAGLIARLRFPPSDRVQPSLVIDAKEIDPSDIEMKERLGAGQFGEVTKGIYKHEFEVAVKTMKEGSMSEDDFIDEAKVMVKLQHNNLVKLYGVCTKKKPIMIVTEYMRNGALLHFLRRQKHHLKDKTSQLLDICIQVCSAMEYLEANSFIHRDLAARNCLVGKNTVVKVADFGLARFVIDDEYTSSFGSKYPVKWSSPEILGYTRFSSKSDVWAFGVLMWEVFTCGEMPFSGQKNHEVVDQICHQHRHLSQPDNCPETIFTKMLLCWQYEPEDRPTFAQLYKDLVELMERDYVQ